MPRHSVAQYTNADAQTTVKANVKLNELQPPDGAVDINAQKIEDVGAPDSDDDAPRRDTIDTKINTHAALATHLVSGLINMWHGTIANIPSGWVICDGNNSTPNLLTRFIEGVATAATNPGATGGATAKTTAGHIHTMPTHTHTMGTHKHTVAGTYDDVYTEADLNRYIINAASKDTSTVDPGDTNARDPGDANTNTDGIADIRPLFYDIAFLMKT